ncbi:MAG: PAS domain S-box protein [Gallionella sp.]|nr:PAS domain S-box protein [Gallionella sp.]
MAGNLKFEKIKATRVLLMLACLLGMAIPIAPACAAEPVKIGVLTYRPKSQTLAQWQPLAAALKQAVPGRDFVVEALDFTEMETAVAARQLDFALTNPAHYILLAKRGGMSAPLATLAADAQGKAVAVSGGVIFSRAGQAKINSLADLRGKTIATTSTGSVGGYQAQAYELKQAGIRLPQDAKMLFTGMPLDNVVAAVLADRADAGFVRAGVLEDLAREDKLDMAQVKIINRQDLPGFPAQASTRLYPQWSFAASSHIDENLARNVAAALFLLEENLAAAKAMNIHGFVIPADYTPVEDMLRELRLPPFDAAPEFSFSDVWRQYRWQAIFSLITAGLILLLGLRLLISNRKLKATHLTVLQQKQQLEESEQRYRLLFSNNPLPMFILAEDSLAFLEVNERAIKHYGFTREEFSRMTLYDIRVVEGGLEFKRAITSSPGDKVLIEARQKKKDGAVIDAAINAMPIKYGTTPAWIALMQDITGRRAIQRKMAEQLAFIKAVINAEVNALSVCHGIDEPPYTNFTVWNPSMEALTGYRMEEINHLGWYQTVYTDPELQEQARQRMERIRQGDHLHGEEWTITRKDGGHRVVQVYTVTVTEDKRGAHTLAVMQDITERKQVEKALREKTQLLDSIVDNIPSMVFLKRASDLRFVLFNRAGEALVGHSRNELLGRNDYDFFPKEQADFFTGKDRATLEQGGITDIPEEPIETSSGSRILHTKKLALRDEQGQPQYLLGISEDITERKQIEAALQESEKLYRSLFENTLNGLAYCQMIFEQDQPQDFIYLSVNAAFETLTGLKNVAGKRVSEVIPGIRQSDAGLFEIYGRVSLSGKPEQFEIYLEALQQWFWISVYSPEKGYFLAAFDIITERKKYEEELKRSNAELEQFGYAISHDMRQPLRMVSSYLQLIEISLSDQLDSEKRDYFNFAIDGAKRIDQMLVALLEYSRVGRMGELPRWIESRAVFDEALLFLQPAINEAQARLDISGDWPSIFVNHDEILRLMQNLIGNAAKFRVAGRTPEITITSKLGKNEWHLCVADNGIGLIPDQIKRLFQMFQRLQLRAAYEGNGVGLALCRKIVEHHKGRIWAESAGEGQGSKFHVVLPVPPQST